MVWPDSIGHVFFHQCFYHILHHLRLIHHLFLLFCRTTPYCFTRWHDVFQGLRLVKLILHAQLLHILLHALFHRFHHLIHLFKISFTFFMYLPLLPTKVFQFYRRKGLHPFETLPYFETTGVHTPGPPLVRGKGLHPFETLPYFVCAGGRQSLYLNTLPRTGFQRRGFKGGVSKGRQPLSPLFPSLYINQPFHVASTTTFFYRSLP